ncbi:hypothetical protein BKA93DRAFT_495759 [Sparassis latifolia]
MALGPNCDFAHCGSLVRHSSPTESRRPTVDLRLRILRGLTGRWPNQLDIKQGRSDLDRNHFHRPLDLFIFATSPHLLTMVKTWPNRVTITTSQHMKLQRILMQNAEDGERESDLYHALNWGLTFNALRSSIYGKTISVHPQAELRLIEDDILPPDQQRYDLRDRDRPASGAADGQLQERMEALSLSSNDGASENDKTSSGVNPREDEERFFDDNGDVSAQFSAIGSVTSEIPDDRFRQPDFLTVITFPDEHQRILFIHEAKTLTTDAHLADAKTKMGFVYDTFSALIGQIVEQAQFGFSHYPDEQNLYVMATVQFYFCIYRFCRDRTPKYDEYNEVDDDNSIPDTIDGPYFLLNDKKDDYHPRFKYWWTRSKNAAS